MKRTLLLKKDEGRLSDRSPVILGSADDLTLEIDSAYNLAEAVISLQNGKEQTSMRLTSPFLVPKSLLISGWLNIVVCMYLDGAKVKQWRVMPLKIVEHNIEVDYTQEMHSLEADIATLKQEKTNNCDILPKIEELYLKLNELADKHNKLTEIVKVIKEV